MLAGFFPVHLKKMCSLHVVKEQVLVKFLTERSF